MKLHSAILLSVLFLFFSCEKEKNPAETDGFLIGYDYRFCACCGGYWLTAGTDSLRSFSLPDDFASTFTIGDLPLPVSFSWDSSGLVPCGTDRLIRVTRIRKR
jgi:hypothetical protein